MSAPVHASPGVGVTDPDAAGSPGATTMGGVAAEVLLLPTRGVSVDTMAALAKVPEVATT